MGMNFYLSPKPIKCPSCGKDGEKIHIGKSSYGWAFSFQAHPDLDIMTYQDWLRTMKEHKDWVIIDENDEEISYMDFLSMVQHKKDGICSARLSNGSYPLNAKEKEYLERQSTRKEIWESQEKCHFWVDEGNYGFTDLEFS